MQTDTPAITIPKLEGETPRAYAARVEYLTMGAGRSLDRVAGQGGGKNGARVNNTTVENWSVKYGWKAAASEYDQTVATLAAQAHAESYRRELEDHRERYGKAGKALHNLAAAYLNKLAQRIKDLDSSEIKAGRLALDVRTAAAALQIAGDLEAHALRVADLLPKLDSGDDRGE
jgi:hypothetical protein